MHKNADTNPEFSGQQKLCRQGCSLPDYSNTAGVGMSKGAGHKPGPGWHQAQGERVPEPLPCVVRVQQTEMSLL